MEVTIKGEAKEIAALVLAVQGRQTEKELRREVTEEAQKRQRSVCVFKNRKVKIEKR